MYIHPSHAQWTEDDRVGFRIFRAGAVLWILGTLWAFSTETVSWANILGLQAPACVLIIIGLRQAPLDFRRFLRSLICVLTALQLWLAFGSYTNDREARRLELEMHQR